MVQSITRQPATTDDYLQSKSFAALRTTLDSSAGMGLIHFDPSQISKRMNYKLVKQRKKRPKKPLPTRLPQRNNDAVSQ